MRPLLQAELLKLRTTRTFAALTGAAVGTSLLLVVLTGLLTEPKESSVLVDVFASDTSSLFILVLAVIGVSGEWRHRTIAGSLLAAPDRLRFLVAKALAFAAAGLLLSISISIAVSIAGFAILGVRGLPLPEAGELIELAARSALVSALMGAFGACLGALVRNQVVAIVGVLLLSFFLEPLLLSLAPGFGRFGPFTALPTAVFDIPPEAVGLGGVNLVAPGVACLLMLAWIGAAFAGAGALLQRRDLE
jgi:ABC-2 type transport system permease protein